MPPQQRDHDDPQEYRNRAFDLGLTVDVTKTCEVLDRLDDLDDTSTTGLHRP